jgi:hypothetical protein
MNQGKLVFAQLMQHLLLSTFRRCVARYQGEFKVQSFSCLDVHGLRAVDLSRELAGHRSLFARTAIQALSSRDSLHGGAQYFGQRQRRAGLAHLRRFRATSDCYGAIALCPGLVRRRSAGDGPRTRHHHRRSVSVGFFLGALPRAKAAVKLHTLLDLRGNIPTFIHISDGKMHEVNVLDQLLPVPGAFYDMDRGFLDFARLFRFHEAGSFFITRALSRLRIQRRYSRPVDRCTGLLCDQTVVLTGFYSHQGFAAPLRRIRYKDPRTAKTLIFLTNNFTLPALTIAELYRCRWQVELFFKWIKQHLRIKAFFGTSENAVKSQIWIAVSAYVLVAIVKKRLRLAASLYEILQIFSLTMFEKIPLDQLLAQSFSGETTSVTANQLILFD